MRLTKIEQFQTEASLRHGIFRTQRHCALKSLQRARIVKQGLTSLSEVRPRLRKIRTQRNGLLQIGNGLGGIAICGIYFGAKVSWVGRVWLCPKQTNRNV